MDKENIELKLVEKIQELGELELVDQQLCLGIFLKKAYSLISEKLNKIEIEFDSKMDLYSARTPENENKKAEILAKYKQELEKVLEKYEDRFINVQLELQGVQSNQKIALANWKKILDEKDAMINSSVYKEFVRRKKQLEYNLENALKSEEFYEYDRLLKSLQNPTERIELKANACIEKFNNYNQIIDECLIEANICENEVMESLESVIKYKFNDKIAVKGPFSKFSTLINKIIFKFSGASKFQKEVVVKMENDLNIIQNENNEVIKSVEDKNCHFVATILIMRQQVNDEFKVAIS